MTTGILVSVLRRRWIVVAMGLILTVVLLFRVHQDTGVYWTQTDVAFLPPVSARYPNNLEETQSGVIAMAGLVAAELNADPQPTATASAGATLAGQGVREGYLIRLPNSGGQWAQNFDRPVLDVQVIGPSEQLVRERLEALVRRIMKTLHDLQANDGVARGAYVTTMAAPTEVQVFHLNGQPTRAAGVTAVLGTIATVLAAVGIDRLQAGARRRRSLRLPWSDARPERSPGSG